MGVAWYMRRSMAVKGFDLPMEEEDMAKMELKQFGPIHHCVMESKPFTVLTGPQASGKSTIAKVVFLSDGGARFY